jgi:hypothetical protein
VCPSIIGTFEVDVDLCREFLCSLPAPVEPDRDLERPTDPVVEAKFALSSGGTGGIGSSGGSVYNSYKLTKDIPDLYASRLLVLAASESAFPPRRIGTTSSLTITGRGWVGGSG